MFKFNIGDQVYDQDGNTMTVKDMWYAYKCESDNGFIGVYAETVLKSASPAKFRIEPVESFGNYALQQWDGNRWCTIHTDIFARVTYLYEAFEKLSLRIPPGH